jgi:hypothetical protein
MSRIFWRKKEAPQKQTGRLVMLKDPVRAGTCERKLSKQFSP